MYNDIEKVIIVNLPSNYDGRGILTSIESDLDIPFEISRIFYMHEITGERGGHAHIDTDQVVIPVYGSFKVSVFNGVKKRVFEMDEATKGLYIPRLFYTELNDFSSGAVCLVLANTHYNIEKSLRNIKDYLNYLVTKQP